MLVGALAGTPVVAEEETAEAGGVEGGSVEEAEKSALTIWEGGEGSEPKLTVKAAGDAGHIRPRGQDFKTGEVLLRAGTRLGPAMGWRARSS